jgi:hypothetical protein
MVTLIIGYYLLRERQALAKLLVPSTHLKLCTGVMAILIESALPLSLAGIIYATLYLVTAIPQGTQRQLDVANVRLETTASSFAFLFNAFCVSLHFEYYAARLVNDRFIQVTSASYHHFPCHHRSILGQPVSAGE